MSTITIKYNVSEAVRRAELGAGRDASREREIVVTPTPALAAIANLTAGDGIVALPDEAHHVLSDETAESWALAKHAMHAEAEAERRQQKVTEQTARETERAANEARCVADAAARIARDDARLDALDLDLASLLSTDGYPVYGWRDTFDRHPEVLPRAQAARAERDAAEAETTERWKIAAKVYVLANVPEYVRAASEGCDVTHRASEHVREKLVTGLGAFKTYNDEPHTCPGATAYAKLDDVRAKLAAWPELAGATLTITRADVEPRRDTKKIRTCVHIEHVLPWGADVDLSVLAEPEPDDSTDEDES